MRDREVRQHKRPTGRCSDPKSARVFSFTSCSTSRQTRVRWCLREARAGASMSGAGAARTLECVVEGRTRPSRAFSAGFFGRGARWTPFDGPARERTDRLFRCGHCEVTDCRQDSQRPRADSVEARGGPRERRRAPRSAPRDRPRANRTPGAARAPACLLYTSPSPRD